MWEYKIIDSAKAKKSGFLKGVTIESAEEYLNSLGAEGWEIIDPVSYTHLTLPTSR